jgi:hypothetical protein
VPVADVPDVPAVPVTGLIARPGLVEPALGEPTEDVPEDRLALDAAEPELEPPELAPPLDPPPAEPPPVCANAGTAAIANARPATPKCFDSARMERPPLMSDFLSNANG